MHWGKNHQEKGDHARQDMLGGAAGDVKLPDLGGLDIGAIADKAKAAGLDPEQLKGFLSKFTGPDGKLDLSGPLDAAKGMGLDHRYPAASPASTSSRIFQ